MINLDRNFFTGSFLDVVEILQKSVYQKLRMINQYTTRKPVMYMMDID